QGARPPEVPPPRAHLPAPLRLLRALRPPPLPRRGRPRQGLALGEDARRRLAEGGQPPAPLRPHGGPPRQEAPLHGERVRPARRVEPRPRAGLGPPRCAPPRRPDALGRGRLPPLPRAPRPPRRRPRGLPAGVPRRPRQQRPELPPPARRAHAARRAQWHDPARG